MGARLLVTPETDKTEQAPIDIAPQSGPQFEFAKTQADIAIYGGAAGGGKTFGLLLEPLRHYHNPKFKGVIFRRTTTQVRNKGGLWDESMGLYPLFKAQPTESKLEWTFPSKGQLKFAHLEFDKTVLEWQGAQIPFIGFDELTHFSEHQFFYMVSRLRSVSGIKSYIRANCNPDPDSWVRRFIDWWIGKDGFPIKERSGKLRWFIRRNDEFVWASDPEELYKVYGRGSEIRPKSVTFIPAKLEDNKIFMDKDPDYVGNLLALDRVTRGRLKDGNWNIRASAGTLFKREWFRVVDAIPAGWTRVVRFWDRAATKPNEKNPDPDWTRGLKLYSYPNGRFIVGDLKSIQETPGQVEEFILNVASHDTRAVQIKSQTDPGSAGKSEAEHFVRMLRGYVVSTETMSKDKATRAKPVSAQAEHGNVWVLNAPWNEEFFSELENFSDDPDEYAHDDIVDTLSGAFNELCTSPSLADVL